MKRKYANIFTIAMTACILAGCSEVASKEETSAVEEKSTSIEESIEGSEINTAVTEESTTEVSETTDTEESMAESQETTAEEEITTEAPETTTAEESTEAIEETTQKETEPVVNKNPYKDAYLAYLDVLNENAAAIELSVAYRDHYVLVSDLFGDDTPELIFYIGPVAHINNFYIYNYQDEKAGLVYEGVLDVFAAGGGEENLGFDESGNLYLWYGTGDDDYHYEYYDVSYDKELNILTKEVSSVEGEDFTGKITTYVRKCKSFDQNDETDLMETQGMGLLEMAEFLADEAEVSMDSYEQLQAECAKGKYMAEFYKYCMDMYLLSYDDKCQIGLCDLNMDGYQEIILNYQSDFYGSQFSYDFYYYDGSQWKNGKTVINSADVITENDLYFSGNMLVAGSRFPEHGSGWSRSQEYYYLNQDCELVEMGTYTSGGIGEYGTSDYEEYENDNRVSDFDEVYIMDLTATSTTWNEYFSAKRPGSYLMHFANDKSYIFASKKDYVITVSDINSDGYLEILTKIPNESGIEYQLYRYNKDYKSWEYVRNTYDDLEDPYISKKLYFEGNMLVEETTGESQNGLSTTKEYYYVNEYGSLEDMGYENIRANEDVLDQKNSLYYSYYNASVSSEIVSLDQLRSFGY